MGASGMDDRPPRLVTITSSWSTKSKSIWSASLPLGIIVVVSPRGDTEQGSQRTKHTEIIGYDHEAGAARADVLTSRLYTPGRHPQLHARGRRTGHDELVWREGFAGGLQSALERRKDAERRVGMAG